VSRPRNIQQLIPDVTVERRQSRYQLAAALEIQAIQQLEHDARRLLQAAAMQRRLGTQLELAIRLRELVEQVLVLIRDHLIVHDRSRARRAPARWSRKGVVNAWLVHHADHPVTESVRLLAGRAVAEYWFAIASGRSTRSITVRRRSRSRR